MDSLIAGLFLLFCSCLIASPIQASQEPIAVETKVITYYNFYDLLIKAKKIVVAQVGANKEGCVELIVHEIVKNSVPDPKHIDPEKFKRAAALLKNDKLDLPPPPAERSPLTIWIIPDPRIKFLPEGTQSVFFLWEESERHASGEANASTPYLLSHPQCIYDIELLPQIKAAVALPRSVSDGRYLREGDRQMEERARQRENDKFLLKKPGGQLVLGLGLSVTRAQMSVRGDNSIYLTAQIENTRSYNQAIYDGPLGAYGIRLRPKNGEAEGGKILRASLKNIPDIDSTVLAIPDSTDYIVVPHQEKITKELFFDATDFPVLAKLTGEYLLGAFYLNKQDGTGVNTEADVWLGTLISDDVIIRFKAIEMK